MLEGQAPAQIPAENRAHPPEERGAERLRDRRQPGGMRGERMWERDQPNARERGEEEPREPATWLLSEHEPRAGDGDERLRLLQDDHRDEVPVEERLREEDGRRRRRARADQDPGEHVTRPRAPERDERGHEQRQRAQDEDDVLAEDDGRRGRRVRERLADQAVESPHRRRDADEDDAGDVGEARAHRSKRRRSDTGCRARTTRAWPSATRTAAGFGTPLYVDAIASV